MSHCSRDLALCPRGPWLQSELCCLGPSMLNTTPSASPAATLRFRFTLYATPSLCGSASASHGTFPTFTAVLSVHVADPTPAVRQALPLYSLGDSRLPPLIKGVANRDAVSASYIRRAIPFRRCIVRFMLRPTRLPCPPDWLRRDEVTCSSSRLLKYFVTPAFDVARYRSTLGVRLDGRMGNLPSSGLSPDQLQQLVRLHDKNYWLPNVLSCHKP